MRQAMKRIEGLLEIGGMKKDITLLIISGIALIISLFHLIQLPFDAAWIAIILCGIPIILEAVVGLVTRFDIKADVLVSLALIASVCIGEIFAAGEVAFIMQLGALLEDLTVARARAGIEKLVKLTPQTGRVIHNGKETIIPAEKIQLDDVLRVLPGETIPVDGIILSGETSINQAVMTGESLPVDKSAGDDVSSGTVNQFGAFEMKATRVGEDSSIQRMIRLVQSADAGKAKIVGIADRWATWIVVIALSAALITWLATGQIIRAVTILVVFCPCALVLATPTAVMAAIGNATKHGFLVREGDALERLASVSRITFDKTGTLTIGAPKVSRIIACEVDPQELYRLTASAEQMSEHPLGKAIVQGWQQQNAQALSMPQDFLMIPGEGISAGVDGIRILAGNNRLLERHHIDMHEEALEAIHQSLATGASVILVAMNNRYAGYIELSDTLRPASSDMIRSLQSLKVEPVLVSGDHTSAASTIASKLGIQDTHAECSPEDKLALIDNYQRQGEKVCMVGDGINDAPALKKADIGIAMAGAGSDIAVDAADIALVDDKVEELPHLIALSKRMMTTIKVNLTFSMTLNFIAIALAISGMLNPVVGALVHNAGSVLVIINSALLLKWKKNGTPER